MNLNEAQRKFKSLQIRINRGAKGNYANFIVYKAFLRELSLLRACVMRCPKTNNRFMLLSQLDNLDNLIRSKIKNINNHKQHETRERAVRSLRSGRKLLREKTQRSAKNEGLCMSARTGKDGRLTKNTQNNMKLKLLKTILKNMRSINR